MTTADSIWWAICLAEVIVIAGGLTATVYWLKDSRRHSKLDNFIIRDATRYRFLREHPTFNTDKWRLEWYLPRGPGRTLGERFDAAVDAELAAMGALTNAHHVANTH